MSSSSSTPSSTSTAGSSSGSTGSHLPYAPFPYPLPSGGRGSDLRFPAWHVGAGGVPSSPTSSMLHCVHATSTRAVASSLF
ncbi:hypothetical protein HBI56_050710 [Parastagonospora nodorum]|nr:hypothetical protein HBH56_063660 [Parastagonospora nodorum]KAH3930920.1 hypothetical protein HBH54_107600 [Parastagonospora nodorum]KAH3954525.1 hypothetical protein HBH53_022690 [Parastagonospora nodorum]KAH3977295.1 hypothetical protein HBH52_116660 [Parastagonospora nodorum]KAH4010070.1 hypothetical protein HBI13_213640 [Parastagonospora nodorum]